MPIDINYYISTNCLTFFQFFPHTHKSFIDAKTQHLRKSPLEFADFRAKSNFLNFQGGTANQ